MAMFVSYVFLVLRTSLFLVANDQLIPITTNTNRNTMPYPRFGKRLGCLGWPGATRQLSLGRVKITLWNMKIMIYIMIYIAQGACCLLLLLLLLWADDTREKGKFTIILYQRAWGRREHNPCNYHCIVYCCTQITNQLKKTNKQDKHWLVFLAGGFAGIFSWVTTYPQVERYNIIASWRSWKCSKQDVIKSRVQGDGWGEAARYRGSWHCLKLSFARCLISDLLSIYFSTGKVQPGSTEDLDPLFTGDIILVRFNNPLAFGSLSTTFTHFTQGLCCECCGFGRLQPRHEDLLRVTIANFFQ